MDLRVVDGVEATRVHVDGEIDAASSRRLRELLFGTVDAAPPGHRLVIDLAGVTFMDSTGLGVLVGTIRRARDRSVELRVENPSELVGKLLRTTGVIKLLPLDA